MDAVKCTEFKAFVASCDLIQFPTRLSPSLVSIHYIIYIYSCTLTSRLYIVYLYNVCAAVLSVRAQRGATSIEAHPRVVEVLK
jgi:hypothetical protein